MNATPLVPTSVSAAFGFAMRGVVVVGLSIVILVALLSIRGVVHDRQLYRQQAVANIAASHAGAQRLAGPVLVVPYEETELVRSTDADGRERVGERRRSGRWTYFPETLALTGTVLPATRRLGLHEVPVYELQARVDAHFAAAIPAAAPDVTRDIGRPWLAYGIADVRGLAGVPQLQVGGNEVPLEQGMGAREGGGIHARLAPPAPGATYKFDTRLDLTLSGTESLAIAPLGGRNRIALASSWPHPRFDGAFLPRTRRVDAGGFEAAWEVTSLASNAQAQFLAHADVPTEHPRAIGGPVESIGISLVDPVNPYTQADRATKYGMLFVLLTFGGFFLFETVKRLPIHPIQYLLVGLALAIFFLMLLALSEHIAFGWAYLVASAACIALIAFYLGHVLRSRLRGLGVAAALAALYAALYGLLVSEDNALVLGAGLLFVVLAAAMIATRNVDWYALARERSSAA